MTDKDQAIAPDCWVVIKDGQIIGINDAPCHLAGIEAVRYVQAQPPAPDCRTCEHRDGTFCGNRIHRGIRCTNGDKYQPAPKVVLWRTE